MQRNYQSNFFYTQYNQGLIQQTAFHEASIYLGNKLRNEDSGIIESSFLRFNFKKYGCLKCEYIYDEAKGDPDNCFPAGTRWSDLPDNGSLPLLWLTKKCL